MLQKPLTAATTFLLAGVCTPWIPAVALPTLEGDAQFRRLARRALSYGGGEAQLFPGQLPKALPVDLPLPPQTQIIGSIVRTKGTGIYQIAPGSSEVYLDVSDTAEHIQAFYQQRLPALGWTKSESLSSLNKGFIPSTFSYPAVFCKSPAGPSIQLIVSPVLDAPTDVRLTFSNSDTLCKSANSRLFANESPLPTLSSAPQTEVLPLSRGGGNMVYESSAHLNTKLSSQALVQHYELQMERAGWTQQNRQHSGDNFWSSWKWKDSKGKFWQAYLALIKTESKSNQYFASIVAF
jgi:hypothetical protein